MILADKVIALRKKNGWSQEELAEMVGVTRQAVSKWEGAQAVPDLDKVLKLAQLFGISTDYLLKDELEEAEYAQEQTDANGGTPVRHVSMQEANEFLTVKAETAPKIAFATFLCILSPICLMLLAAAQDTGAIALSENVACGIGMIVLVLMVALAVVIFATCGMKTKKFEYLEEEVFETEYGVTGMVKERKNQYQGTYNRLYLFALLICVLSVLPLFSGVFFSSNVMLMVALLCMTMLLAGVSAALFILAGIPWASFQKLLQEGDYSKAKKRSPFPSETISTVFWLLATAVFLCYSFATNDWQNSWIVWPVAGVLYAALVLILNALEKKRG